MSPFNIGDTVIRLNLRQASKLAKGYDLRGHQWFSLVEGETAVVSELEDDAAYLQGKGDWPHHIKTLAKVGGRK